ncbi:putative PEP-binding protein [Thermanaeromonas toyohensis]
MCGELGGEVTAAALLVGLGLDEITLEPHLY